MTKVKKTSQVTVNGAIDQLPKSLREWPWWLGHVADM